MPFFRIVEKTLNQNPIVIYDHKRKGKYYEEDSSSSIRNEEETFLALEKQRKIIKEFKDYVYSNENC